MQNTNHSYGEVVKGSKHKELKQKKQQLVTFEKLQPQHLTN